MENSNTSEIKNRIIAGLYGGDIIVLWSVKNKNPEINWVPLDFLKYDPSEVSKAAKELINEGLIKTYEKDENIIYYLSYLDQEKIKEVWFNFIYKEVDRKLSPVLKSLSLNLNIKVLIKPKWDD